MNQMILIFQSEKIIKKTCTKLKNDPSIFEKPIDHLKNETEFTQSKWNEIVKT